jgi:hypothetical protein
MRGLAAEVAAFRAAPLPTGLDDLMAGVIETRRLINLLELGFAQVSARFAEVYQAESDGNVAVEWIRDECRMTSHAARTALQVGEHREALRGSIEALQDGSIGMAHLGWMASTADRLSTSPTADQPFDENRLLPHAKALSVQRFRRQCEHLLHAADHAAFVGDQVLGVETSRLRVSTYDDGSVKLDGVLHPEGGAIVLNALSPFTRPSGADDYRTAAQRNADALIEICNHLMDETRLPQRAGQRPHLHVTTSLETLMDFAGANAAELEAGALLSGTSVQRLACDATMVRVLVNTESMVVDVGRAARVVPPSTRRALNVRDRGCTWPGCDRNASLTQAHHLIHWASGGPTNLNNLVLLCRRHHWMVHEGGFVIARTNDGTIVTFAPLLPGDYPRGREPDVAFV